MSFEDLGENNSENEDAFTKISRCIKGIQSSIHVKLNIIKNNKAQSTVEIYGTMVLLKGKDSLMGNIIEVKKGKYIEILPGNNTDKSEDKENYPFFRFNSLVERRILLLFIFHNILIS